MPSGNMQYFVRTAEGKEYGPADQDMLVQWAESGRITSDCEVRNALMKSWQPATKVPFLEGIVKEPVEKPKKGGGKKKDEAPASSLNRPGKFKYVPATLGQRFLAWVIDMAIVGVVFIGLFLAGDSMLMEESDPTMVYAGVTLLTFFFMLVYYTIRVGLTAQTFGQLFMGIMVVRVNGDPCLVGRAWWWTICYLLLGWSTWFFSFVLPSKRALQDMVGGVRVIRITIREIAASVT